jgi:hypothetical protein
VGLRCRAEREGECEGE